MADPSPTPGSPTPGSPTPQSPTTMSDSDDAPVQENQPNYQTTEQPKPENTPQQPTEQSNLQQQELTMGQDLMEENKTLAISSLSFEATEDELADYIKRIAPVQNVRILKHSDGKSRGVAFCDFQSVADAEKVKNEYNGAIFKGRTIHVEFSSNNRRPPPQNRYYRSRGRPRPRFNHPYRDLDAPINEEDDHRSYDLNLDDPEPKNQYHRGPNQDNRYRGQYQRRPYRPYDQVMGDGPGRVQDYRTRPQPPQPAADQPPMPF